MATFPVPLYRDRRAVCSSGFGPRDSGFHSGCDITFRLEPGDAPLNQYTVEGGYFHPLKLPALAYKAGRVVRVDEWGTGGHMRVEHGRYDGDEWTQYIHLVPGSFRYRVGDYVREAAPLAQIGYNLRHEEGDIIHLHYQQGVEDRLVDPAPYLRDAVAVPDPWRNGRRFLLAGVGVGLLYLKFK